MGLFLWLYNRTMKSSDGQLRGVNLGGWLILEKWMTPSLFEGTDAVDEYTFMRTEGAARKIEHHRQTFITEADFAWLEKNGINAVRIPIGYWVFEGDEPYTPTIDYLDWAVEMARKYHLKVLIDLHGAKDSQNGNDHSGRIGPRGWYKSVAARDNTAKVLEELAAYYSHDETVWGLELLNEPKFSLINWKLRRFYKRAYERIVKVARPGLNVVFSDAFTPRLMSGAVRPRADYPVIMDIHWYQFASIYQKWDQLERYFRRLARRPRIVSRLQYVQPVIIGEWSVVLSGEILRKRLKKAEDAAFKRHGELQMATYSKAAGWFYWTYKTEGRGIWHFRSLVEDGILTLK